MRPGNVAPGRAKPLAVAYPPKAEAGPTRVRMLPCLTCQAMATGGCLRDHHLIGEPADVLPPLTLRSRPC